MSLYQNEKNGQIVELISYHDKDHAMIRNQAGAISYVSLADLVVYESGKGRTSVKPDAPRSKEKTDEDAIPVQTIPPDTRLNLNMATAEMIAQRIKGVGYSTAKKIVEMRMSLPGERFQTLDQVRSVGRVDWDQVIKDDLIFVG